ncbi:hypothetical protein [Marinifilum flexuosum]|uniref:hypothetical protein n=1 Tax=Marinifilum flexuosum TaxID=1117708 RepID=UPI002490B8C1|nr:hypothetical protein [Marinifilum flexuosum]
MEQLLKKIIESRTLIAFLFLFFPFIIAMLVMTNGQNIGIPKEMKFSIIALFYPYLQLVLWIYWMHYSANRLGTANNIDMTSIKKYNKLIGHSKVIFIILLFWIIINSIIPQMIEYPKIITQIIKYISYILIVVQLYLFYSWIYGFWILTKTLNDIYEKNGKERSMTIILFFLLPLTYGLIHRKIKNELVL